MAEALTPLQAAALDDPATWSIHTRWLDDPPADASAPLAQDRRAHTRLLISGIHCAACSGLIEDALLRQPGVLSAEVSAAAERAVITWQPGRTQLSGLVTAVRAAGYGAFPDAGAEALDIARKDTRDALWRLFVAAFCMMQVMMYAAPSYVAGLSDIGPDIAKLLRWASWLLSVPVMLFSAGPYLTGAWRSLRARRIGMDVPVVLGLMVTFVASSAAALSGAPDSEVYFDSLTMFVTFLLAARWLEGVARRRAARSLDALMRRLPDAVERLDAQDQVSLVSAQLLVLGDRVRVQAGQAFAADGVILSGQTAVDESMLTGESQPVPKPTGAVVLAGCLNLDAPVVMRVDALGTATRYQRIVELVERALTERPQSLLTADRWAGPFLWGVIVLAALAWAVWQWIDPSRALWVAVSVLIVTCPCALSIGAPVAYLASAGQLARRGILVQRLDALEVFSRARDVIFDKTGTLTEERLGLAHARTGAALATVPLAAPGSMVPVDDGARALQLAAGLARQSHHPLSKALVRAAEQGVRPAGGVNAAADPAGTDPVRPGASEWTDVLEVPGKGLVATWCHDPWPGRRWRLGQDGWAAGAALATSGDRPSVVLGVSTQLVDVIHTDDAATVQDGDWALVAVFEFDERLRDDAAAAMQALQADGVRTHLLSGDRAHSVAVMGKQLHMTSAQGGCSPEDKLTALQALQGPDCPVVMVGDGINDAPVLARADVSIAMGSAAAMAQARADVIILANCLLDVSHLHHTSVQTLGIVKQNLGWAVFYNIACVPLALMGWLPPWAAGLGMAGSSLGVVLNALRLTRFKGK